MTEFRTGLCSRSGAGGLPGPGARGKLQGGSGAADGGVIKHMSYKPFDTDALIDAAAPMLKLRIEPDYREGIRQNLKTAAKMAALIEQVKLDDATEPAPVFRA